MIQVLASATAGIVLQYISVSNQYCYVTGVSQLKNCRKNGRTIPYSRFFWFHYVPEHHRFAYQGLRSRHHREDARKKHCEAFGGKFLSHETREQTSKNRNPEPMSCHLFLFLSFSNLFFFKLLDYLKYFWKLEAILVVWKISRRVVLPTFNWKL